MVIGIDIDNTITNTTEQTDIYAKEFTENILQRKFKINKQGVYDPMWAKSVYGWTEDEDRKFWNLYYEKIIKTVKPKEDAVKTINELYKYHKIIIISARWEKQSNEISKMTTEWLKKYDIHFHKLCIGHIDKRDISKENNIDLFIEDSIQTCNEVQSLGIKTFLMTSRQNENMDTPKMIRVNNWKEVYERIINN